jgi:hypothetical protein
MERAIFASDLTGSARLILLALCALANAKTAEIPDEFQPSLTRLVSMTGLARSTVAEQLNELEKSGWVKRKRPKLARARAQGERTHYRLKIPKGSPLTGLPSPEDTSLASTTTGPPSPLTGPGVVRPPDSGSPLTGHVLTALNQAEPQRAERIVMEHTGATAEEAAAIAARVRNERQPRSLPGLLRRMGTDGDLAVLLTEHRAASHKQHVAAALAEARKGPPCDHGTPGGAALHPVSNEPLCPQCRMRARLPKARPA